MKKVSYLMSHDQIYKQLIDCLNHINALALQGKNSSDGQVRVLLDSYFNLLKDYHGGQQ